MSQVFWSFGHFFLLLVYVTIFYVVIVVCFVCFYELRTQTKTLSCTPLQIVTATLIYISIPEDLI